MLIDLLSAATGAVQPPLMWADLGLKRGIDLGFFTLRYYSLAYLVGILFGFWHMGRMIRRAGSPLAQRHVDDLFLWCTIGIIAGGRLGYALFYMPSLFTHPLDLFKLWEGGMSFHGGLIGVVVAIWGVCRAGGLSFIRVCDYMAPCAPVGLLLGRLANFINGELWGRVTDSNVPWAMVFPDPAAGQYPRHPSQLYEAGLEGAVLLAVLMVLFWRTQARWRPGLMMGVFAAGYGVARFIVEFYREPDQQLEAFARATHMSMGQWLCVPMIALGLWLIARALTRPALGAGVPVSGANVG
ncbi:prolipoprotein diacylglyceryl transferase [Novosphingobium sp. FSY-8]|uniref:Phosphatidylglycerol--prolipoprotein diacylglyceryl transferase n=1 Tax=Novosphingobium ovatum TaxID=1908523 RepID=A0ABW9XEZ6_9SPHN|nr:prolipoprotein diacylglyceryl transferase [Novosphingobium ovatum]NBC37091.1 prolipoprotein diacylglyceryl transferase [Novosphingobium ovatum]